MRHGSLFSGIGGFDLAAQWMGWKNIFQVEKDPFCRAVLTKNFPNTNRYDDIKTFDGTKYRGTVDIVTGGFPCQPFSTAGKRKGKYDDRYLWPEMLRVIREIQPSYVVGENVRGITNWDEGVVFDSVQSDLEAEGYEVLPFLLPACGIGAPHRRDRVWFIAANTHISTKDSFGKYYGEDSKEKIRITRTENDTTIPNRDGSPRPSANSHGNQRCNGGYWKDFPTQPGICRRDDGIPNRIHRIKALGNAVVPQVVYEIFKAIELVNNGMIF